VAASTPASHAVTPAGPPEPEHRRRRTPERGWKRLQRGVRGALMASAIWSKSVEWLSQEETFPPGQCWSGPSSGLRSSRLGVRPGVRGGRKLNRPGELGSSQEHVQLLDLTAAGDQLIILTGELLPQISHRCLKVGDVRLQANDFTDNWSVHNRGRRVRARSSGWTRLAMHFRGGCRIGWKQHTPCVTLRCLLTDRPQSAATDPTSWPW
jgi:hypothetical protein